MTKSLRTTYETEKLEHKRVEPLGEQRRKATKRGLRLASNKDELGSYQP